MKKYLFIFALLLTLLLVDNDASAQTTAKPTNEQLEAKITELEKGITELEKEVAELKSVDELKSDMQDSLLNSEKDNSSKIYNASIWFITVVGLFVGVGGIYLTYFSNKLAKHEKKINMVLDSKDFDSKVEDIEQRLATIRFEERLNTISTVKRQFKTLCKEIDKIISDVEIAKEHNVMDIEDLEEILNRDNDGYDFNYYISEYERVKNDFIEMVGHEITPMDDEEDGETVEESLLDDIEDLESFLENFEEVEKEINAYLMKQMSLPEYK